ncbi:ABC transporter permease [Rhodococcus sp. NPDC078407]|uniref:ABC transporter permease n=1 Tax=Rhodococcus sp. NPDC078407 TaxID=3364509 RepID=UPI0037CA8AE5
MITSLEADSSRVSAFSRTSSMPRIQAKVEIRNRFATWTAIGMLIGPAIAIVALHATVGAGADASRIVVGLAAASVVLGGFVGVASELVTDQADGTVLRARTLPVGLRGYLVGKVASLTVYNLVTMMLLIVPAQLFFGGILPANPIVWIGLVVIGIVGLASTVPAGAVVGCAVRSPLALLPVSLVSYALMAVSGIFFPVSSLPTFLEYLGKATPIYWIGSSMRLLLTPELAESAGEAATSQVALGILVLGLWTAAGLVLAPRALKRMSGRQSGVKLAKQQELKAVRGY